MTPLTSPLDLNIIEGRKEEFQQGQPFPYLVLDNFLDKPLADQLADEFPNNQDNRLFVYDNPLEVKLALNDWNAYPPATYQLLQYLNSKEVVDTLSDLVGVKLYPDHGLHGGGWHMHAKGGKLNPHLDYSIHPKLKLQRKLNLIIYLSKDWEADWGGHLGFWSHDSENNRPGSLDHEMEIKFNRALLFDTTHNSWHGISQPVNCPVGHSRNSIAIYYLAEPSQETPKRMKALYAPTEDQQGDQAILDLIKKRVDPGLTSGVYKKS